MPKLIVMFVSMMVVLLSMAAQCQATTRKGTQCKRQAMAGSQYCWQHGGKGKTSIPEQPTTNRAISVVAPVSPSAVSQTNSLIAVNGENQNKDLGKENEALRRENQKLRRELVRQKAGEPIIDMAVKPVSDGTKKPGSKTRVVDDGGWWMSSSGKRHNSKCRYYKTGNGHPCKKDEGTPCKKCGG